MAGAAGVVHVGVAPVVCNDAIRADEKDVPGLL